SGCPPGRVFHFQARFSEVPNSPAVALGIKPPALISATDENASHALRHGATPLRGLTVDDAKWPAQIRSVCKLARPGCGTYWTTTKLSTEYPYYLHVIRLGCVCVCLSHWG